VRRTSYPTALTDAEWERLLPHLPPARPRGRPRKHSVREILDAIFYVMRGGCAWRLLPHDLPPWGTAYYWFRRWRLDGLWQRILVALRRATRQREGRDPEASVSTLLLFLLFQGIHSGCCTVAAQIGAGHRLASASVTSGNTQHGPC
jgi:putative transposase